MAGAASELPIIARTYDLVVWSCKHFAKFPRSFRFTLGSRMEQQLYSLLDNLLRAKYTQARAEILKEVNLQLEALRFQFRIAKDLQCLSMKSYEYAARAVNEIGQMVGGWLRKSKETAAKNETIRQPVGATDVFLQPAARGPASRPRETGPP